MSSDGKDGSRGRGEMSPEQRDAFHKRASELGQRLDDAKARRQPIPIADGAERGRTMARALRVSTELIGGIVVGSALGWFLDEWLGTRPWLFILFFLLGSAAGILSIVRTASRERTPPTPSVKDDDH